MTSYTSELFQRIDKVTRQYLLENRWINRQMMISQRSQMKIYCLIMREEIILRNPQSINLSHLKTIYGTSFTIFKISTRKDNLLYQAFKIFANYIAKLFRHFHKVFKSVVISLEKNCKLKIVLTQLQLHFQILSLVLINQQFKHFRNQLC